MQIQKKEISTRGKHWMTPNIGQYHAPYLTIYRGPAPVKEAYLRALNTKDFFEKILFRFG